MYIGRNASRPASASPLANPFTVGEHGPSALDMYRKHLLAKLRDGDPAVISAMRRITADTRLVCSCKPRPCHGDIVAEIWRDRFGKRAGFVAVSPA